MCFSIISFYLITQIRLCYFFSTSLTMVYSILFWFSFCFIWLFVCFEQSLRGNGQKIVLGLYVIVQGLSHVRLFGNPWIAVCHVSLSFTISQSLLKFMPIELVMLFNHLILCHPLLLLPLIFISMGVFSSESALHIRWPKYWSFSLGLYEKRKENQFSSFITCKLYLFSLSSPEFILLWYCPSKKHTESQSTRCDTVSPHWLYCKGDIG